MRRLFRPGGLPIIGFRLGENGSFVVSQSPVPRAQGPYGTRVLASQRWQFWVLASLFLTLLGLRLKSVTASPTGTSEVMKGDAIITLFLCLFADSGEALPPGAIGHFRSGLHTRAH